MDRERTRLKGRERERQPDKSTWRQSVPQCGLCDLNPEVFNGSQTDQLLAIFQKSEGHLILRVQIRSGLWSGRFSWPEVWDFSHIKECPFKHVPKMFTQCWFGCSPSDKSLCISRGSNCSGGVGFRMDYKRWQLEVCWSFGCSKHVDSVCVITFKKDFSKGLLLKELQQTVDNFFWATVTRFEEEPHNAEDPGRWWLNGPNLWRCI